MLVQDWYKILSVLYYIPAPISCPILDTAHLPCQSKSPAPLAL
jgi:hypothetical protein